MVSSYRVATIDKLNPFTMKGTAAAYLSDMVFDTLLLGSQEEPASAYALLAEKVEVAPDFRSVTFTLNAKARFHNGDPVLASDVAYSYNMLISKYVAPAYLSAFANVAGYQVLGPRTIRFTFNSASRELPLTLGSLPVFSPKWGAGKPFDQVVNDIPIGSGPYRVGSVRMKKDITYVRDANYWARDLNVRKGMQNFDKITVKSYADNTARLEALKAGEFDLMQFFSAGDWARRLYGSRFRSGELLKGEFEHHLAAGFQSYVLNTRKAKLQDVRVRQALGLAMDFEWMSRQLFFGAYARTNGLFKNTECQAQGWPDSAQLALLQPYRAQLPADVFGPMALPPQTGEHSEGLRSNLLQARELLRQAGWTIQHGVLRNAAGQTMTLEYLDSQEAALRTVHPWARNLHKLGIALTLRVVDFSLYQERLSKFDFDIISIAYQGTLNPGQEYANMFGSKAADTPESSNYPGVKSAAVDALIARMASAQSKAQLLPACRALERVIAHSHVLIPQWYAPKYRMVYNQKKLQGPKNHPPYMAGEGWIMDAWWARSR